MNTNEQIEKCPICSSKIPLTSHGGEEIYKYNCPVCGQVNITMEGIITLPNEAKGLNHLISGFTRERTELSLPPTSIGSDNIKEIIDSIRIPINVSEKLDRLLLFIERKTDYAGMSVQIDLDTMYPVVYAKHPTEFEFFVNQLRGLDYVNLSSTKDGMTVRLTLKGWDRIIELQRTPKRSNQVFVAMWFTPETKKAYDEGLFKAIDECGFVPVRIDLVQHNDHIDDRIIAEIRKSAFLVADFTGLRGGVYFEAGFAMGLGIPVIWTCRKDYLKEVHFDTRQYNHIEWESESELYEKLKNRIEATILI